MRVLTLFFCALLAGAAPVYAAESVKLPDIGSPADAALSKDREAQIGRMAMLQLRESGKVINDPLTTEYINSIGHKLSAHAQDGGFHFQFFVVDEPSINAFALPGGYIGVNSGLIEATRSESELAGVLAHEIAHVTQRHIARSLLESQKNSMFAIASMLAAIVLGATAGGQAAEGAIMAGQAAAAQNQISFSRANEEEADRVGIGILAASGFDPQAMPDFFETLNRRYGRQRAPEFLLDHPVTASRIAETRGRADQLPSPDVQDSPAYALDRARLRVITSRTPEEALKYFRNSDAPGSLGTRYGMALAMQRNSRWDEAARDFESLLDQHREIIAFHIGLAQAQTSSGDTDLGLKTFADAMRLFPRNVPLTIHYAQALLAAGQPAKAHSILLDLLNNVDPTPEQVRLIAIAASSAGMQAESHYYMAEYHLMSGNLMLAVNELRLALSAPDLDDIQRARFRARIQYIRDNVPDEVRRQIDRAISSSSGLGAVAAAH